MSLFIEEEVAVPFDFDWKNTAHLVTEAALSYIQCPYEAEINLLLTDNENIHRMNQEFREIDRATDVLSFPMLEYEIPGDFSGVEMNRESKYFTRRAGNCFWGILLFLWTRY